MKNNPGIYQNKLCKILSVSGRDTSRIVNSLENLGEIKRTRIKNTYELYIKNNN